MAAMTKNHGVRFIDAPEDARTVQVPDFSTIAIVAPADEANPSIFPLNTNVHLYGDEADKIATLGDAGELSMAIDDILAEGINASMIIRRVEKKTTRNEQLGAVIGDPSDRTGIWGLLDARAQTAVRPGIIIAPGFCNESPIGATVATMTDQGQDYTQATVTFNAPGAVVQPKGHCVIAGGKVSVIIDDAGFGIPNTCTMAIAGDGTGAEGTVSVGPVANPVALALSAVAKKVLGIAVIDGPNLNRTEAALWAERLRRDNGRYLYAIDPALRRFAVLDGSDDTILTRPASTTVAALFAKRDRERGGPYWSPENQTSSAIVGTARPVSYYDGEVDHEANFMVSNGVNTFIEGKELYGSETLSNDSNWRFINKVRTENAIRAALPAALRKWRGENFTAHNALMIVKTIEYFLDELVKLGVVVGYTRYFDRSLNPNANMRQGILRIELPHENTPIISDIQIGMRSYLSAFDVLAADIQQALGNLTPIAA
ncbi:Phage tail sheath protein FI-like protein [Rhodopseudomonas palustris TIE-1]|uniref:phage tail sheath protein FI n=1 Tax=Rhodopseudomonas palustris TaxID=1076 RepID=UPI000164AAD6|nr:phage tail sheath protein FI [Rhodopseudomonas palustris]ACE99250.1 Phage tail sheath protein FI-like protein [Rhodopseudomonas palustris TIE-1]